MVVAIVENISKRSNSVCADAHEKNDKESQKLNNQVTVDQHTHQKKI